MQYPQGSYGPAPAYGAPPVPFRQETTFFVGHGVQVTSSRFVVFGQMYPLQGVTSVSPFTAPAKRAALILLAVLVGLLMLMCLSHSLPLAAFFGVGAGICVWRAFAQKDLHGVAITTAGMQVRAFTSHDIALVQQIVGALHQAIATR
jgi:hypothetical protein